MDFFIGRCRELLERLKLSSTKSSCSSYSSLTKGLCGHRLKAPTRKYRALLHIMKWNRFLAVFRIKMELFRWIRCRIFVCRVQTFSGGWISLKTSRQMPQTNSWSLPHGTHIGTPSLEMEPSVLVSWYLLMSPGSVSTILISCFLDPAIH